MDCKSPECEQPLSTHSASFGFATLELGRNGVRCWGVLLVKDVLPRVSSLPESVPLPFKCWRGLAQGIIY